MIVTLVIYIINIFLSILVLLLPSVNIIPQKVYDSIAFIIDKLVDLNSIFLIVDNILIALVFFIKFLVYFLTYKIIIKLINLMRGAEGLQ